MAELAEQQGTPAVVIRPAGSPEVWAIRDLLSVRDGRAWSEDQTRWFLSDLDPDRCLVWLAWHGEKPVGITTLLVRQLALDTGPSKAGYWANLFILPEYRGGYMLYPRLPLTMLAAVKRQGLSFVYAPVRLRDVAAAHLRIGFKKLGEIPVLVKPLRPMRLLSKYRSWGKAVAAAGIPVDFLWSLYPAWVRHRARRRAAVESVEWSSPLVDQLLEILVRGSGDRIRQMWSTESFRYRFSRTREGGSYHLVASFEAGVPVGAVVYRIAERDNGIRVGVIMDAFGGPSGSVDRSLLAEAEQHSVAAGCEAMLFLDGLGPSARAAFSSFGYRRSPEVYEMVLWSKVPPDTSVLELANWRFSFADHDAF